MSNRGHGKGYAPTLGDDAKNNGVPCQRDEMVKMRRQIATLTEIVQRLLPPIKSSNGFTERQLDDSFNAPHRHRADSHGFVSTWNDTIKNFEFPEFRGSYNPDVYEEWLKTIESHFECYDVPEAKKVKLVSQSLKGSAFNWWK
ncbi:hypothetical protein CsSME_00001475 [Camellia sinensis var. sinensis]